MSDVKLPEATGEFGDKPTITFPGGPAPRELQVTVLEEGKGAVVESGQTITVNYLGQSWDGGVFDNSYDRGAPIDFPIGVGMVIAGWDEGLVGRKIGDRVMLTIPGHLAYGPAGVPQAGIGPNETLVFVVDILDAE
ncbi:MAG: FKBP-type peptidyl-prolyl cis-trans isomerase [Bowdeniella nasicola]|nr:FKBP-type peptidyl-prolyl cis-trans isomerase [Bowdeniella nasicola]